MVSIGPESGCGLAGSPGLGVSVRLRSQCQPRLPSSQGSPLRGCTSTLVVVCRFPVLPGHWLEPCLSSCAVGSSIVQLTASEQRVRTREKESFLREKGVWERQARKKPQSFCSIISEVTSHHFYSISFVRSGSLGAGHSQREEITEGHKYQEVGTTAGISEAAYHSGVGHLASRPDSDSARNLPWGMLGASSISYSATK